MSKSLLTKKLEYWEHQLLDLGKRNKMINYRETKRTTLKFEEPSFGELFERIAIKEESLSFQRAIDKETDIRVYSLLSLLETLSSPLPVSVGDIKTEGSFVERQKTLKNMRNKARLSLEEQGTNILYLSFGFIEWKDGKGASAQWIKSPLVLVPAVLTLESLNSPYTISKHEDDIVVNPTLDYYLNTEYGIDLPDFEPDKENINDYLKQIEEIADKRGWKVIREVSLGLLSFLKISMYNDLLRNVERIRKNPVIKAMAGDSDEINNIPDDIKNFDLDSVNANDCYQVMSADSSQQDAILYSKRNISFVMQGPPGTGKSQTITNIIAEALADGKKVLFVSEKMAALQVVYKRLQEAHLGDFCLPLHSYKANKKEILEQIGANLKLKQTLVNDTALVDLDTLSQIRRNLNDYAYDLHKIVPNLNISCYDIYSKLEILKNAPSVLFSVDNILQISQADLQNILSKIQEYALSLSRIGYSITNNPWDGLKVRTTGYEYSEQITSELESVINFLNNCLLIFGTIEECKGLDTTVCFDDIPSYFDSFRLISKLPDIPKQWLSDFDETKALESAYDAEKKYKKRFCIQKDIGTVFNNHIYQFDFDNWRKGLKSITESLSKLPLFSDIFPNEWVSKHLNYREIINSLKDEINTICECYRLINNLTGTNIIPNKNNITLLTSLLSSVENNILLPTNWFYSEISSIIELVQQAKNNAEILNTSREELLSSFEEEILTLDFAPMLLRYKTEYTSFLKVFKSQYKQDKKAIQALSKTVLKKLDDETVVHILIALKTYHEKTDWFEANHTLLSSGITAQYYCGEKSDWDCILSALDIAQNIKSFENGKVPQTLAELLSKDHSTFVDELSRHIDTIKTAFDSIEGISKENHVLLPDDFDNLDIHSVLALLAQYSDCLEFITTQMELIVPYIINEKTDIDAIYRIIDQLNECKVIEIELKSLSPKLSELFGQLFCDEKTDWQNIINLLNQISDLKKKEVFSNLVPLINISVERKKHIGELADELEKLYTDNTNDFKWISEQFYDTCSFDKISLNALSEKLIGCRDSISLLEGWIDYQESKSDCISCGLENFITSIEKDQLFTDIDKIFLKGFYLMWLGAVCNKSPSVRRFRKDSHEKNVEEFGKLDDKQLLIAQMRIREKLIKNLPNDHHLLKATDEVAILNRELGKKRNIMPLRKLFRQIPNLLMRLKPCLMMSPLSVAYFLETEAYRFDLVIFDEASQIFPEDAIGAIFRGSQVIIAGDSKQLPPTNIYSATTNNFDGDYDIDDSEEYSEIVSDSILEESASVLPNRTLLWHYRSKHESLISFSNREIYKNSLITFPCSVNHAADMGVEYIYVENGYYEGGGKNCNIREAQKCVMLVLDHIQHYPNRSLGIIAFSEKQQTAIENAIIEFREKMPKYEWFFDESKEEPFFVKNLENVQGDERDTIIFSICYARDKEGKMYMRFGPLGHEGGERRLNVAITRAKCNVKLVGSILPSDIDLTRTNSEGVRMLRSYIEFARKGEEALKPILKKNEFETVDTFCDVIAEFITSNGYTIHRNVGCSDYTIDIAVENPNCPDEYIAGIECDGLSYMKARTARDRDHLRKSILQNMGWNLYRVWSTEWSKNPEAEKNSLLMFLKSVFDKNGQAVHSVKQSNGDEKNIYVEDISSETDINIVKNFKYTVLDYLETNMDKYYKEFNKMFSLEEFTKLDFDTYFERQNKKIAEIIENVVIQEAPIHIEVLVKKLRSMYEANEKTIDILNEIRRLCKKYCNQTIYVSKNFLYLKGKPITVIRKHSEKNKMPLKYVCDEELSNCLKYVIDCTIGITIKDLYKECIRIYGYTNLSSQMSKRLNQIVDLLVENNQIRIIDGKVQLLGE